MYNYFITIIDSKTLTQHHLVRRTGDIEGLSIVIDKKLGGDDNISFSIHSTDKRPDGNYIQSGSTKDGSKLFTIIAIKE